MLVASTSVVIARQVTPSLKTLYMKFFILSPPDCSIPYQKVLCQVFELENSENSVYFGKIDIIVVEVPFKIGYV